MAPGIRGGPERDYKGSKFSTRKKEERKEGMKGRRKEGRKEAKKIKI